MYVVIVSIILYIICVVTNKPKMAGYYLILYYCALFECNSTLSLESINIIILRRIINAVVRVIFNDMTRSDF